MEQKTVTIPFDLETAKRINIGGIVGRIVTEKGRNRAEIVYEDNSSSCPLLVVIHSISVSASPLSSAWYWSSTEVSQVSAWFVIFSYGGTSYNNKRNSGRVRTVIDF